MLEATLFLAPLPLARKRSSFSRCAVLKMLPFFVGSQNISQERPSSPSIRLQRVEPRPLHLNLWFGRVEKAKEIFTSTLASAPAPSSTKGKKNNGKAHGSIDEDFMPQSPHMGQRLPSPYDDKYWRFSSEP